MRIRTALTAMLTTLLVACSGGGGALPTATTQAVTPRPLEVSLPVEDVAHMIVENLGAKDAPRAVLLAADHGYGIDQIVTAAAADRLDAGGEILTSDGNREPPKNPPWNLFAAHKPGSQGGTLSSVALIRTTGSEVLDEAVDAMRRVDVYKGRAEHDPQRAAERIAVMADTRSVAGGDEEFVTLVALALLQQGYTPRQVIEGILLNMRVGVADENVWLYDPDEHKIICPAWGITAADCGRTQATSAYFEPAELIETDTEELATPVPGQSGYKVVARGSFIDNPGEGWTDTENWMELTFDSAGGAISGEGVHKHNRAAIAECGTDWYAASYYFRGSYDPGSQSLRVEYTVYFESGSWRQDLRAPPPGCVQSLASGKPDGTWRGLISGTSVRHDSPLPRFQLTLGN